MVFWPHHAENMHKTLFVCLYFLYVLNKMTFTKHWHVSFYTKQKANCGHKSTIRNYQILGLELGLVLGLVLGLLVPAYHERTTENAVVFDPVYPVLFGKLFIGLVLTGCRDVKSLQMYKVVQIINFFLPLWLLHL